MKESFINYRLLTPGCEPVITDSGDWIDLKNAWNTNLKKGEFTVLHFGIAVKLPRGYEAIIAPRSSTFSRYGFIMTNSIGVIDEAYSGDNDEWGMPVYATRDVFIPFEARIAQFRILKHQPKFKMFARNKIGNIDRGGFGSTGI